MKVLIINALYPPYVCGGAEQSIQQLAQALVQCGTEVVVAATVPRGEARTVIDAAVKVVYLPMANLYWPYDGQPRTAALRKLWHLVDLYNPCMRAALSRTIERERPDVVHTNNLQGLSISIWYAARAAGLPVLHSLRDYALTCERACRFRDGRTCATTCWECRPFAAVKRRASAAVQGVVGNSRSILDHHRTLGFFPAAHLHTAIPPSAPAVVRGRRARHGPVVFGYLGRLEPAKGVGLLVDTFARRTPGGWELHIAGSGPAAFVHALQTKLTTTAARAPIRFVGWVNAVSFFQGVDVLIVPSLWDEPLPRVILEAAACGIPVIASRCGGITEVVAEGVTGLLFDPAAPSTLEAAVDDLLADAGRRQALGRQAAADIARYAPEVIAARYAAAYSAVRDRSQITEHRAQSTDNNGVVSGQGSDQ